MKPSTFLTAGEASRATGKSIPTITRNVKNGNIANSRFDRETGEYEIDPTALFNRYPAIDPALRGKSNETPNMLGDETPQNNGDTVAIDALKQVIDQLETRIDEKDELIADYKGRLIETKALTDQRSDEAKQIAQELAKAKVDIELKPKITSRRLTLKERIFGGEVPEVEEVA